MCYIVRIWTLFLLSLGNNIVTLLFNWRKQVHYVPTDKINASIRIRRILKVKIECKFDQLHHITISDSADWQSVKLIVSDVSTVQKLIHWWPRAEDCPLTTWLACYRDSTVTEYGAEADPLMASCWRLPTDNMTGMLPWQYSDWGGALCCQAHGRQDGNAVPAAHIESTAD